MTQQRTASWPLDDLAGTTEIAEALGVGRSTVTNWATRYGSFPRPLRVLASGPIYSLKAVVAWNRTRAEHHKRHDIHANDEF